MSYLAFALKYRPQSFDEVIGQEQVVISLRQAIVRDRVHHAYLFSGPRGVGKTSLARILAKSLNCLEGPTIKPCGKCPSCQEISRGTSLDIIEIDGASNRGIDEIRTLRENVKLSSAGSRFKIYIIDEVHMLTQEAFNALLKTLEEPPPHVKFIFATTHPQKVIPTILSRCQKFQFSLLPVEKIVQKLKIIVKSENIKVEDNLLYAVAKTAGGSIRDAESLLDQLAPVILENGSIEDVFSFLGIIDEETLNKSLRYMVEKDLTSSLSLIDKVVKQGKDLGIFINGLIEHLRNLLLSKVSAKAFRELIDISPETKDFMLSLSDLISTPELLKAIDLLIEAKELSSQLQTARVPLELALIKFSYKERNKERNNPYPSKDNSSENRETGGLRERPASTNCEDGSDFEIEELEQNTQKKDDIDIDSDSSETAGSDNLLVEELRMKWQSILSHIQKVRVAIASHLSSARLISSQGNVVNIAFLQKDYFHKEIVESSKNLNFIEVIISKLISKKVGIKFTLLKEPAAKPQDNLKQQEQTNNIKGEEGEDKSDSHNEFINDILDTFGGKIHPDD